jgi:hypothetical protein
MILWKSTTKSGRMEWEWFFQFWLVYLYWARYLVDKSRNSRETCDTTAVCPFTTKNVGIMVKPYSVAPSRRNTRLIYGRVLTRQLFRVHVYICANPNPCWRVHEGRNPAYRDTEFYTHDYRPYSKSSLALTLNEWRFNLSFSPVSMLFLNSWMVSVVPYYVTTQPAAIQKQHWHSREAQIEPPLIECECEWAFRIRTYISFSRFIYFTCLHTSFLVQCDRTLWVW